MTRVLGAAATAAPAPDPDRVTVSHATVMCVWAV